MNHIYKVVFCRATGTFVAVAEYAKAQGKKGGNTVGSVDERSEETSLVGGGIKFAYTSLVSASLIMVGGQAMATPVVGNSATCFYDVTSQSVVCGDDTTSTVKKVDTKTAKSVVFGKGATNTGESNVAVGILASSAGTSSVALGDRAKAGSDQTIAVGQNAQANARWDISIGRQAGWNATAPAGDKPEGRNVAIGDAALKNGLDVNNNNVMGTSAGENLKGSHNVIIGTYANAAEAIKSAEKAGSTDVQINTKTRKVAIINGDTGLPNGEQDAKYIETTNSVAIGHRALTTKTAGVAIGQQAKAFGTTSSAVGNGSRALGDNSVAMGNTANAGAGGAIAIGQQANYQPEVKADLPKGILQDISAGYKTTGANSIAIGVRTNATSNHSIAMGTEAKATANGAVAVGSESNTSGVNATAIGQASEAKGKNSFAAGNDAHAVGTSAVAVGDGAGKGTMTTEEYKAGNYANAASGDSSTAVGVYTKAKGEGSTAVGLSANAQTTRSVAVGAESSVKANQGIAIGDTAQVAEKGLEAKWNASTKAYDLTEIASTAAIAVGKSAVAKGTGSVAVGHKSKTEFMNSTAVGNESKAVGYNSSAFGFEATAKGISSVAIGDKALAGTQDDTTHTPAHNRGVAVGTNTNATGETAVALGSNAESKAHRGTALGVLSKAGVNDSVALGAYSIANRNAGVNGADPLSAKQASADASVWTATHAAVSVGNDAAITDDPRQGATTTAGKFNIPKVTRQITGVAAGSQDTDAVNVAQLKAAGFVLATTADTQAGGTVTTSNTTGTDNKIVNGETLTLKAGKGVTLNQDGAEVTITTDLSKADKTHYFSVNHENTLQGVGNNYNNDGATGRNALAAGSHAKATGEESTAIGHDSSAEGKQSVAVGYKAKAKGEHALAIGDVAEAAQWGTAVGYGSRAEGVGSPIAIGTNSQTIGGNSPMAIGDWATANGSGAIAIGSKIGGAHEADKSTFAQGDKAIALGYLTKATQRDAMALGAETSATAESTVAIGKKAQATDSNSISIGRQSGSAGIDLDNKGANNNADITSRTKAGKTNANGLVNVTSIGNEAGSGTINNNYGVNIGYQAGSGGYNSYYGEGVSIGNKAGGVDKTNATVKTAMEAFSLGQGATDNAIITGNTNTAISSRAGVNALGHDNVAIGKDAGGYSSGNSNIAIGRHAGRASKLNTPNNEATRVIDGDVFSNARNTISMGEWANASGDDATAVGRLASASGASSMALGHQATAKPEKSVAIGYNARAVGTETSSISIGENAYNNASGALVIGKDASAKGFADVLTTGASPAKALPYNAIAIGKGANVDTLVGTNGTQERSTDAIAIGTDAKANYASTIAIGYGAKANTKSSATAIGLNSDAQGWKSLAVGVGAVAKQTDSVALGSDSVADTGINQIGADPLNAQTDKNGHAWKSTKAAVSVGNVTGGVTRQITSVAAGTQDTDAVNVAQLKAAGFVVNTASTANGELGTKTVGTTKDSDDKVQNGETLTIEADKNIKVTQTGAKVTIATKDDVEFSTVTTKDNAGNQTLLNGTGLTITPTGGNNPVSLTSTGLNNGGHKILGVADGNIAQGSTDAVNGGQLFTTNTKVDTNAANIAKGLNFAGNTGEFKRELGDKVTVSGGLTSGTASNTNIRTVANNNGTIDIQIADAPVFTGVVKGHGFDASGQKITNVAQGDSANDAVNVAQLEKAINDVKVQSLTKVESNSPFSYINSNGDLLKRDIDSDDSVKYYKVSDGTEYTPTSDDDITITALNPKKNQTSVSVKVGNVSAGTDDKDAVNVSQLKDVVKALGGSAAVDDSGNITQPSYKVAGNTFNTVGAAIEKLDKEVANPLKFVGDNAGEKVERKLNEELKVKGGADQTKLSDNNIGVVGNATDNSLTIKLAKDVDLSADGSLTAGDSKVNNDGLTITKSGKQPVSLTSDGLNNGGNVISNVASNLPATTYNSATQGNPSNATKAQSKPADLDDKKTNAATVGDVLNAGWNVQTNGNDTDFVKPYDTVNFADGDGTSVTSETDGDKTTFKVNVLTPVVYTDENGNKLYKQADGSFRTQPNGGGDLVDPPNVIASMHGPTGLTNQPVKLANVAAGVANTDAVNVKQLADAGIYETEQNGDVKLDNHGVPKLKGLNFAGNDGTGNSKLGDTWKIVGGNAAANAGDPRTFVDGTFSGGNIKTAVKDGAVEITMADSPKFGDIVINAPAVTDTANPTNNRLAGRITGLADGVDDKDAVTVKQLKDKTATTPLTVTNNKVADLADTDKSKLATAGDIANAINNTGFTLTTAKTNNGELGANATNELIKAGDSVTVEADDNIKLTQADGKITIATKKDVKFDSVTVGEGDNQVVLNNEGIKSGNTTVNNAGITIKAPATSGTSDVKLTANGLNNGGNKITNVAKGTADTDAVNVSQLKDLKTTTDGKLAAFTVGTDKNATAQGITVDKDKARFDIVGADNGKVMTQVDGNKIAVDLTADAKNSLAKADSAVQSIQVKANGEAVTTLDKDNNTLDITQGDNITVSNDGGKVKVALNQDVTGLNSLTSKTITAGEGTNQVVLDNDGVKVGGNAYISANGLNANDKKITNVTNGDVTATSKDAINGSQLHTVSTATKNLMGGNATVNTDGTVTASNIGGTNANTIDDAIKTVKTTVKSTDNSIKVTANTADKTNGTVFDISVNAQGLAESAQLPVVYTNANGEKVYKQTDGSFNTQADGQGSQVLANDVVASMQNGTGSTTAVTKLTNIANGDVSANSKDAVNGSQLFATNQNVTNNANAITGLQNQTFKLQANGDTATAVKASDTVQFLNGDNIAVTRNANDITIATKKDVKFDSVTAGEGDNQVVLNNEGIKSGNTTVNNEGVTIKAPVNGGTTDVKLTANGLNNGGNKITNVADGAITATSKDAVNGGQLHAVKTTAESKLGAFTVGTDKNATAQGITVDKDKARFDIVGADDGKVITQVDGNKIAVDLTADTKDSLAKAESALQSIQVKANGTDVTTLGKDNNTLDITQGDNITVSNDGGKVKVALNQDVASLNSLTSKTITAGEGTNQVVLDNIGVNVGGKTYISDAGLNANSKKVTNVADGAITADSKDAVNGSQLHTVSTATKNLMGGNATVNTNGTVTASNIGGTNANTIDDAIKTVKTTVKSTDNSIKVTANTADKTNGTVFDISVNAQGLAESAQLPVVYTKADGTKVYKVGSKFFDNKEGTGTEIEATNIIASMQNADGTITPTTLANIKAGTKDTDAVNVSQLKGVADTLGGGASINADGTINAPTYNITNPADGGVIKAQNVGDALNALNTAVNNPLAFAGDTGLFNRNLGQTTTIKGGVTDENKLSNSNIGVVAKDGTLDIKLAKDITIDSVTTGNTTVNNEGVTIKAPTGNNTVTDVKLTANGLNNGGNKITNVADGEIVAGSKDAVNGGQLFNIKQDIVTNATNVAKGLSFAGNTGEFNSQLGDKVTVSGGLNDASITSSNTNIRTVAKDGKVDIQFADAPVFTGKVSAKGLDAGNQKITGVLAGDDKTDAVNVEQLSKALANVTVANQSLVQANSPFSYINKAGEQLVRKVAVVNGKSVVTFEKAKDGSIYTGDDITITALNPTDPQTTIPTLIGNVKAGINDNDVVNVSQLKGVAEVLGAGTTVDADGSIKKPSYTVTGNTYNNVGGALQALNSEVEKPFTFIDDNGEKIARKLGENITVKGGATSNLTKNNIGVVANSATGELNVQLAETVNLGQNGSVAMGDSVINHAGLTIKSPTATNPNNTVSLTANGLNNGGNKISHVADGLIAKDSKDAVNGGQLSAVKDVADSALQTIKVKANGTDVKELTKDNNELNIKGDSNITVTNDNGEVKVDLADVITVGSPNNATGATNNPIKIDGEKGTITGLTNKDLTAADFAKAGRAATEEQLKIVDNFAVKYDTDPTSGNPNKDSVTFAGTPATPAIKAVDDKFTMAGGTVLNNVASAGDYTQAVNAYKATNAGDLNNAVIDVTNKGLKFAGNVGNEFTAKLGTTVGIKGGMVESTPTSATSGDNVITRTDNHGNINIELAKNAKFDSVITGSTKIDNNGLTFVDNAGKPVANSPSISQTGINAGNQRITGVLAGDDKTDAVNVEQLSKALANITVTNQSIVQANSPFSYVNTAGEQLIREVKTVNGKKEVAFKKAKDGTAYTGDDITIAALNPADPQTTLPTTIGNVKAGVQANDAVNVSQLKDMVTALGGGASIQDDGSLKAPEYTIHKTDGQAAKVNNVGDAVQTLNNEVTKPLTFIGDNGEKVTRKLGENITVKGGATGNLTKNNIGVVANPATGELNVQLAETVNLGQNGSVAMGNTLVNNAGITVGDKVALTNTGLTTGDITVNADGINAGNKAISNVANGVNANDAVNVSQLKAVQDSMKTASVTAGSDAITVSKTTNGNNTDYTIDLANSTKADIAKGVDAKNAVDTKGLTFTADAGKTTAKKLGDSIAITGDKNISTNATADGVKVSLNENIAVKEVKADTSTIGSVTINNAGINMGDKQITGLASGLNGKTLEDIKADLTAPERNNAATVGDLATVQNNVTNITNHYNTIIGGTNKDGQVLDANGKPIQDNTGKNIDVADALKTYNVQDNKAKTDNTIITAIKNMNEGGIKFFHVNDGTGEQNVEGSDIHQEDSTASGSYAAAVGYQAKAIGKNANAMGKDAQALGDNSMAFGTGNIVRGNNSGAFGDPSIINGSNSYSIGNNNRIGSTTNNAFALGNDVYLGADASGNDTTSVNGAVALGNKASVTVAGGVALGENSVANRAGLGSMVTTNSGDNVDASKNQVYALAEASDKDKKAIIATAQNSASAVSVGKEGANRQITNVAAGSADSDAVNVAQLKAVARTLPIQYANTANEVTLVGDTNPDGSSNSGPVKIQNLAAGTQATDAVNVSQLAMLDNKLDNAVNQLGYKLGDVEKNANAGISAAMATAALPQAYISGKSMVSGGMASYNGQGAVAFGMSKLSDNGRWVIKISGTADTQGNAGGSIGAGFHW